jgi:hypothetical protein
MGEASLGILSGNNSRSNVNESVAFMEPPAGYYNLVVVLGEWNQSDYRTLDWYNFTSIEAFGGLLPFTPPVASAPKTLIDEYIGIWEEVQSVTLNGTISETAVTTLIERLQDRGFISKAYIRKPGSPLIETQTSHYENGAAYATTTSNGTQIEDSLGEWGVTDRTITSNIFSSSTQTTNTTLAQGGQVTESSFSTSEGSVGDGHAEKITTLTPATKMAKAPQSLPLSRRNPNLKAVQKFPAIQLKKRTP